MTHKKRRQKFNCFWKLICISITSWRRMAGEEMVLIVSCSVTLRKGLNEKSTNYWWAQPAITERDVKRNRCNNSRGRKVPRSRFRTQNRKTVLGFFLGTRGVMQSTQLIFAESNRRDRFGQTVCSFPGIIPDLDHPDTARKPVRILARSRFRDEISEFPLSSFLAQKSNSLRAMRLSGNIKV